MDIIEGNKLISEFLGFGVARSADFFRYHKSWDWIMLAIEKIEELGHTSIIERTPWELSTIHRCWFTSLSDGVEVASARNEDKIAATWQAVVAFIQWYQTQNK